MCSCICVCVCVDLQERQGVIEEMRLVLGEQEETQTQMDLELENRETQIHQLTQGNKTHTLNTHKHTFHFFTSVNTMCLFRAGQPERAASETKEQ